MVVYGSEGPEAGTVDDTEGWWGTHCGATGDWYGDVGPMSSRFRV